MTSAQFSSIVVVGSVNSDVTYRMQDLPRPGETVLAVERHDAPGGKGANQAAAIASFGVPVSFVFSVGQDDEGVQLVDSLASRGVSTDHVSRVDNVRTGSAIILVDTHGENSIVVHPGANYHLTPASVISAITEIAPAIVLAQLEVPAETVISAARNHFGTFVLNPAPIPRNLSFDHMKSLLEHSDILIPNRSELASLTGRPVPKSLEETIECAAQLEFFGTLIVTLGADGALLFLGSPQGEAIHVLAPVVTALDTSGAGDAFCASLVSSLHEGHALIDAVTHACDFASWTTTQLGAQVQPGHGFTLR